MEQLDGCGSGKAVTPIPSLGLCYEKEQYGPDTLTSFGDRRVKLGIDPSQMIVEHIIKKIRAVHGRSNHALHLALQ
jgi:hypothetical protein